MSSSEISALENSPWRAIAPGTLLGRCFYCPPVRWANVLTRGHNNLMTSQDAYLREGVDKKQWHRCKFARATREELNTGANVRRRHVPASRTRLVRCMNNLRFQEAVCASSFWSHEPGELGLKLAVFLYYFD